MSDLLHDAYDATNRADDERLLIRGVASFALRAEIRELLTLLSAEDFFNASFGRIWEAGRQLAEDSRIITLDAMRVKLSDSDFRVLQREFGQDVRLVEVRKGVKYVKDAAKRRQLVTAMSSIAARAVEAEDYDSILGYAHSELDALDAAEAVGTAIPIEKAIDDFWEDYEHPAPSKERILSPWDGLNTLLGGGGTRGALIVFGAPPGGGKSIAILNWAGRAALEGYRVAIFSLEMGAEDLTHRLIAAESNTKLSNIINRNLTPTDVDVLRQFTDVMRDTTLRIFDSAGVDVDFVRQQSELMRRDVGLDIVVVDYLQIMDIASSQGMNREQQVSGIAKALKVLAMKLDVLVLTASQLNDLEAGAKPTLRSLRESKGIGQHADNVIMIHHELDDNNMKTGDMEFRMVKNRRGREGEVPQTFSNHKVRIDEPQRRSSFGTMQLPS